MEGSNSEAALKSEERNLEQDLEKSKNSGMNPNELLPRDLS